MKMKKNNIITLDQFKDRHYGKRGTAIAGCGFARVSSLAYPVLTRQQSALATQRLIHADVVFYFPK